MDDGAVIAASLVDPERFGELFDRHAAVVLRYATGRVGPDRAEDVLADAFLVAFEARARFHADRTDARPWLLGIATNLIHRRWRDDVRAVEALRRLQVEEEAPDGVHRAADRIDAERELAGLGPALRRLHGADLDTLLLYALGGLDYAEIAEATDVPIGTVRSRLHRVRRVLRAADGRGEVRGGSTGLAPAGC